MSIRSNAVLGCWDIDLLGGITLEHQMAVLVMKVNVFLVSQQARGECFKVQTLNNVTERAWHHVKSQLYQIRSPSFRGK